MSVLSELTETNDLVSMNIGCLCEAYESVIPGERLLLPTIQRSLVWNNKRIVDYWDTLRREWFPGLMMVCPLREGEETYEAGGEKTSVTAAVKGDYELFDGQQRMAAILLGFGKGPLSRTHRLWLGLRNKEEKEPQFRITTKGQPFGYRVAEPNAKLVLDQRRKALAKWAGEEWAVSSPQRRAELYSEAFERVCGSDLAGGEEWSWITVASILGNGAEKTAARTPDDDLRSEAEGVLLPVRDQAIAVKVLRSNFEPEGYEEFFRRTGQGGVALTQDELTYSIIKSAFPAARPAFERAVADESIGALAGPTDLALGALRLVRVSHAQPDWTEAERVERPDPKWVRRLRQQQIDRNETEEFGLRTIASAFEDLLHEEGGIDDLFRGVRRMLTGGEGAGDLAGNSFPNMLLASLPAELVDIALMLAQIEPLKDLPDDEKRAFCLWTLFFAQAPHVAWHLALHATDGSCPDGRAVVRTVIAKLESWNNAAAFPVPAESYLHDLRERKLESLDHLVRWEHRFRLENDGEVRSSAFLDDLHFDSRRGKNTLLFLQRDYLQKNFPHYDPVSGRDDDLPIDLDHIIAQFRFSGNWTTVRSSLPDGVDEKNFRDHRGQLINQLGNLRWLCASENRSKGSGVAVFLEDDDDLSVAEKETLGGLSMKLEGQLGLKGWSADDLYLFQQTVLNRSVRLAADFIEESGIRQLTDFNRSTFAKA